MRLQTRFVLATAAVVTGLMVVTTPLLVRRTADDLRDRVDDTLTDVATAASGPLVTLSNREVLLAVVASTTAGGDIGLTLRRGGAELVSVGPVPDPLPPPEPGFTTVTAADGEWRVLTVAGQEALQLSDTAADTVQFTLSLTATEDEIDRRTRALRFLALLIAVGTTGAAALVARFATGPLARLRRAAAAIGPGGAGGAARMPDDQAVDEVDALAATVNDLLDRLDAEHGRTTAALEASRSFTSNAAHELRTPLTSIRANLEVLRTYPDLDPDERAAVVDDLVAENERVQRLLAALRDLARGELLDPAAFEPVDVAELVDAAAAGVARLHPWARIEVTHGDPAGDLVVVGAPEGLRMAVDNLLRNACLHGRGARDTVLVHVAATPGPAGSVVVTVDDDGPGLPDEQAERVFERFARGPSEAPGTGLGLALVRQQADLHGGSATVGRSPLGGCRFRLVLRDPASHQSLMVGTRSA